MSIRRYQRSQQPNAYPTNINRTLYTKYYTFSDSNLIAAMVKLLNPTAKNISPRKRIKRHTNHRPNRWTMAGLVITLSLGVFGWWQWQRLATPDDSVVLADKVTMPTQINRAFLSQVETCFIPVAEAYGYRLDITSGFRSVADQNTLYAQGRTQPGNIVTNARGGRSLHNYGLAVDVADIDYAYDIN